MGKICMNSELSTHENQENEWKRVQLNWKKSKYQKKTYTKLKIIFELKEYEIYREYIKNWNTYAKKFKRHKFIHKGGENSLKNC